MDLENTLIEITERLRQGAFSNEQAISQGIVLRLLRCLGWDTWNTNIVSPGYPTGEGFADFAICHPANKPCILIEVKQPGKAEDAVRQALEYAFHTGVPFILLTDGRIWGFYLPAEQGNYEDRRIYKLDLYERTPDEAAETLRRYLCREQVESGKALETARGEYRNRNRRYEARNAIPEAWRELVEKPDQALVELLASSVEVKAGVRPENDDIAEFLAALGKPISNVPSRQPVHNMISKNTANKTSRKCKLILRGKEYSCSNATEAMVIILSELAKNDESFLQRCSQHPKAYGTKRHYIARTPEELYPDREDLRKHRKELPGGWLLATNIHNPLKKTILKFAAEVAGLRFGSDVSVDF